MEGSGTDNPRSSSHSVRRLSGPALEALVEVDENESEEESEQEEKVEESAPPSSQANSRVTHRSAGVIQRRSSDSSKDDSRSTRSVHVPRGRCRTLKQFRVLCGRCVNDSRVQLVVVILIAINAIIMGIGTFDFVTDDPAIGSRFEAIDQAFLIVFTAELALQFVYHGLRLFLDRWLVFDLVIIVASWAFSKAQVMRAFRIFRAARLITRIETMRRLVSALFTASESIFAIAVLLFLIMYIFTVMFTQLFKFLYEEGKTEYDYFSRLDRTFFTVFQLMTFDAWADVAREVMVDFPWAWVPIICYIVIAGFIIVNLIIAVICDAIATLQEDLKAGLHGREIDENSSEYDGEEEKEELEEDGERWDEGSFADASWAVGGSFENSGEGRTQFNVVEAQVDIAETMRIQGETVMKIEYLTQQLQKLPTPTNSKG